MEPKDLYDLIRTWVIAIRGYKKSQPRQRRFSTLIIIFAQFLIKKRHIRQPGLADLKKIILKEKFIDMVLHSIFFIIIINCSVSTMCVYVKPWKFLLFNKKKKSCGDLVWYRMLISLVKETEWSFHNFLLNLGIMFTF